MIKNPNSIQVDANRVDVSSIINFLADIRQISSSRHRTIPLEIRPGSQLTEDAVYEVGILEHSCMSRPPWLRCNQRSLTAFLILVTRLGEKRIRRIIKEVKAGKVYTLEVALKNKPIS